MNKKQKALESLLSGENVERAAKQAQVSKRQVYRWLKDANFTQPLREQDAATGFRLAALESQALDAMLDVLQEPEQSGASIKLRAARDILEIRLKWLSVELDERLSEIERRLDANQAKARY